MADAKKLNRILRVRTLQLGLTRAQEVQAADRFASERALRDRIAQLAADVAPTPTPVPANATSFAAAAHYRERLHHSAHAAEARVSTAHQGLAHAQAATREAKRDQSAVEKLIVRAEHAAALKAIRALEDLPPGRPAKRHETC